jgi:hypothetical protein
VDDIQIAHDALRTPSEAATRVAGRMTVDSPATTEFADDPMRSLVCPRAATMMKGERTLPIEADNRQDATKIGTLQRRE